MKCKGTTKKGTPCKREAIKNSEYCNVHTNELPDVGRKTIEINWSQVEECCKIQCTGEEIAAILGISYDTLERAIKREYDNDFAEYFEQKSANGKMSLRRRQYETAKEGNVTMQIWLGKQWLGQKEKSEVENTHKGNPVDIEGMILPSNGHESKNSSESENKKSKKK